MSDTTLRISDDIKTAMRAKDSTALNALRALKSAMTNAAIEKGGLCTVLDEPEILAEFQDSPLPAVARLKVPSAPKIRNRSEAYPSIR